MSGQPVVRIYEQEAKAAWAAEAAKMKNDMKAKVDAAIERIQKEEKQ